MGESETVPRFLIWEPRLIENISVKASRAEERTGEEKNRVFRKAPMGYPVRDVQEAENNTDPDLMLRDG